METKHLYNYDLLRGVAILLIVIQHSWSMLDMDTQSWGLLCYGYRTFVDCGVSLFVLLSGALLLDAPIVPISDFYKRRFVRLIYPFLLWATFVYVVSVVTHKYEEISGWSDAFLCFVPYLIGNHINVIHWFVHLMVVLYFLTPFLQRALQGCSQCAVELLLSGWLLLMVLKSAGVDCYLLQFTSRLLPYLGCFVAGFYVRHYRQNTALQWPALCAFFLLALLDIYTQTQIPVIRPLMSLALFTLFTTMKQSQPTLINSPLITLSRYSYTIYLVHIPIVRALIQFSEISADHNSLFVAFLLPIGVSSVVLLLCSVGCRVLEFLPPSLMGIAGITPRATARK